MKKHYRVTVKEDREFLPVDIEIEVDEKDDEEEIKDKLLEKVEALEEEGTLEEENFSFDIESYSEINGSESIEEISSETDDDEDEVLSDEWIKELSKPFDQMKTEYKIENGEKGLAKALREKGYKNIDREGYMDTYSSKEIRLNRYVESFEQFTTEEWINKIYPRIMLRGFGDLQKTKNILIQHLSNVELKEYCHKLDCIFNRDDVFDHKGKIELILSRIPELIDTIAIMDKQKIEDLVTEILQQAKNERITNDQIKRYLEKKGIVITKRFIEDLGKEIRDRFKREHD